MKTLDHCSIVKHKSRIAIAPILLAAVIGCSLGCKRPASLADKITAAASLLTTWPKDNWSSSPQTIPKNYQQAVISLAKEPTGALDEAFRSLDAERAREWGAHAAGYDRIWLTGILTTILAFDGPPPPPSRDWEPYVVLKSALEPPGGLKARPFASKRSAAENKMLAEWPWSDAGGSWHLLSTDVHMMGSGDGRVAPFFEYYASHFKRRLLP